MKRLIALWGKLIDPKNNTNEPDYAKLGCIISMLSRTINKVYLEFIFFLLNFNENVCFFYYFIGCISFQDILGCLLFRCWTPTGSITTKTSS